MKTIIMLALVGLMLGGCATGDYYKANKEVNLAMVKAWESHLIDLRKAEHARQVADRVHHDRVLRSLATANRTPSLVDDMAIQNSYALYLLGKGNASPPTPVQLPALIRSEKPDEASDYLQPLVQLAGIVAPWWGVTSLASTISKNGGTHVSGDYNWNNNSPSSFDPSTFSQSSGTNTGTLNP